MAVSESYGGEGVVGDWGFVKGREDCGGLTGLWGKRGLWEIKGVVWD